MIVYPEAHLSPRGTPTGEGAHLRAFPLSEQRRLGQGFNSVDAVLDFLDVEHSERYARTLHDTYCNIYAHDALRLCGRYIPRVWWDDAALAKIARGEAVVARYPTWDEATKRELPGTGTIRELNANALHDWTRDYARNFGWRVGTSEADAIEAVNGSGLPGYVVARAPHGAGHIAVIVPNDVRGAPAAPDGPVQSQAGAHNHRAFANHWWLWKSQGFDSFLFAW